MLISSTPLIWEEAGPWHSPVYGSSLGGPGLTARGVVIKLARHAVKQYFHSSSNKRLWNKQTTPAVQKCILDAVAVNTQSTLSS